jgi:biopolymer transport protein ExbB
MEVFFTVWKNAPLVAFLLFLISTISLTIFLERFVNVKKSKVLPKNWELLKTALLNRNYKEVLTILKNDKRSLSKILVNVLESYFRGDISKIELRQVLEKETSIVFMELSKRVSFISVSVTLSTLLGLIGTVWGLIEVFGAYSLMNAQGLKLLAKGIATSLNSTALGLLVAIFCYILYWIIEERINNVYTKVLKELEVMLELIR